MGVPQHGCTELPAKSSVSRAGFLRVTWIEKCGSAEIYPVILYFLSISVIESLLLTATPLPTSQH